VSPHRAALELLRGDHDLTTEHGRSRERWRRVALAAVGAGGFRVVSMAGTLLTLPLVIAYAGQERYGLFAVVTTLAALLAFSDLGLGNGLMTALADAEGRGNLERAGRLVSSATALLLAVGLLLGVFAALLVPLLDWGMLLGAPPALAAESRAGVLGFREAQRPEVVVLAATKRRPQDGTSASTGLAGEEGSHRLCPWRSAEGSLSPTTI
jgi:hypothetical protein